MTDVAAIEGAVVDLIDDSLLLGDGQNYLALRNPDGILLDAVGWEMKQEQHVHPRGNPHATRYWYLG